MPLSKDQEALLVARPYLKDILPFLNEMNRESDRGAVLVAASFLDRLLGEILAAFLIEGKHSEKLLDGFNAPFGTFSAKIAGAASLGLISEREAAEVERIRKIRNDFAHSLDITFSNQRIGSHCKQLTYAIEHENLTNQGKFFSAAVIIAANLQNRSAQVAARRLSTQTWIPGLAITVT